MEWPWLCVLRPSESYAFGHLSLKTGPDRVSYDDLVYPAGTTSTQRLLLLDRPGLGSGKHLSLIVDSQSVKCPLKDALSQASWAQYPTGMEKSLNHLGHRSELDYDWL